MRHRQVCWGVIIRRLALVLILIAMGAVGSAQAAASDGNTRNLARVWKFRTDRDQTGEAQGWARPDFDDTKWAVLNVPGTWESQGITTANPRWPTADPAEGYNGYAWYRYHVAVPVTWAGKDAVLRFNAPGDLDWAYLNGQLIGSTTSTEGREAAREYAIAANLLKPGAENVIAIQLCDTDGEGGLAEEPMQLALTTATTPEEPAQEEAAVQPEEKPEDASGEDRWTKVHQNLVHIGGGVTLPADEKVEGDVVAVGGSADIFGYVTGNVVAVGGSVHTRRGAIIDGDIVSVGGRVQRDNGAQIGGEIVSGGFGRWGEKHNLGDALPTLPNKGPGFFSVLLIWGFVSLLAVLLFRDRVRMMAETVPLEPGVIAITGALGLAVTPAVLITIMLACVFAAVICAITIVGIIAIPVVVLVMLLLLTVPGFALIFGMIGVFLALGEALGRQVLRREMQPWRAVLLGVLVIAAASQIPNIGWLIWGTVAVFGYGLAITTGAGSGEEWTRRRWRRHPAFTRHIPTDEQPAETSPVTQLGSSDEEVTAPEPAPASEPAEQEDVPIAAAPVEPTGEDSEETSEERPPE